MNADQSLYSLLHTPDGPPAFAEPLHVGRPNQGDREALFARFTQALDRNWLSNDGPLVREFEDRVAAILGVRHCVAMCNATVALEIAIRALGLSGEVIVPAYTFVATAHALQWQEIRPVFCDIRPDTHNLDPDCVERLITPRTTAILGVHVWGRGCDVDRLAEIARRRNLTLLFDAAHAFGCTHHSQPIGGFGKAEVFSFHATKFVHSGEGGAIATNDDELAEKTRFMRNFGFAGYDNVRYLGTNGKMNELSAAMGLTSLDKMDVFSQGNRENYQQYRRVLAGLPGVSVIDYPAAEQHNCQYIVLDIDPDACPLTRDQIVWVLHAHRVLARRYFFPGVHRMEPYRTEDPRAYLSLPVTENVVQRVLVLPNGSAVSAAAIGSIGEIFRWAFAHAKELGARLPASAPPGESFAGTAS
ncbi:DegT/DnrJ/EryC1/StrS family aminotransferase [Lignipirellula cremea]|uniref:dTDP-4-amino-4,6-dideoxy-D-glucose transaminase n=1 Tax=Lignipirellula cremea TaxID=2528010 RepID=A0A518DL36_9BACT|nr:DegT/DnrJ/EryC1/StrS family aminotransferase [Lignipirellula cremea]QDU92544.1 dTDP-4-amino-4,6-dideoxy-D-glucose transaminase [Lignipirellula cremea]